MWYGNGNAKLLVEKLLCHAHTRCNMPHLCSPALPVSGSCDVMQTGHEPEWMRERLQTMSRKVRLG